MHAKYNLRFPRKFRFQQNFIVLINEKLEKSKIEK